jgi:NADPH-dependent 2,4-dienoyl-CoA reductase/sulfur reductase-like enzyme/nitrite reductase/ring-hydroxylating ferredoxin subunit
MGSSEQKPQGPDFAVGVELDSLREGEPLLGHVGDDAVILVRTGHDVHSIGANCTHYGGALSQGLVVGNTLRCPLHHACFDLKSGAVLGGPALNAVACYEVQRAGSRVRVTGLLPEGALTKRRPTDPGISPDSIVIVGAGPAGAVCAETLRRESYAKDIVLLGAEDPGPIDRPNLSKDYLAGNAPEEWMPLRGADFYQDQGIAFRPRDEVKSIDLAACNVKLANGETLAYGALVLATGAEPIRLEIEGANLPHVHVLRTLGDSRAIIEATKNAKRAVVIGASFIGLEAAASLRSRGLDVTIVGPENVPLARVLGDDVGRFVQKIHEDKGERFELGRKPTKITKTSVVLDDGRELPADFVVMGVGVRPRVALAEAAGLHVDRGIVVDARFRTSDPNVYAIGDVARFPYEGEPVRIEHFSIAERHGRAIAHALIGRPIEMRDIPFFWSAHHDVTISYVGHAEKFDRVAIDGSLDARDATIVYFDGDRVRAVATINRDAASLRAERAFETGDQKSLRALAG